MEKQISEPQEWTWDYVDDLYKKGGIMAIVAIHNAAFAVKDELHAAALQVLERHHRKEVAAEREKPVATSPELENLSRAYTRLEEQLADERERNSSDFIDRYRDVEELQKQFAAERRKVEEQMELRQGQEDRHQKELAAEREKLRAIARIICEYTENEMPAISALEQIEDVLNPEKVKEGK